MLHDILSSNRDALIDRCKAKVLLRPARGALDSSLKHGIPQFIDQLIETLRVEQASDPAASARISGKSGGGEADRARSEMGEAAALHGKELLLHGFTVDEVVHDYGDLCQALTELVHDLGLQIAVSDFHTLNRCLDNAIADAVREYVYASRTLVEETAVAANQRQGFFVHELRNLINSAMLAFEAIKSGKVGPTGTTGAVVDRSLQRLAGLVERSVMDVRATAGMTETHALVPLAEFIAEVEKAAGLEAPARDCTFLVSHVNPALAIDVDRDLMAGALSNLLTNAFKFTYHGTQVTLDAYAFGDRILIDVSDKCGGLSPAVQERMFVPFKHGSADRSGLGLGLAITKKTVEANHGSLHVRSVPGIGCVFTIELPRHSIATRSPKNRDATHPHPEAG